MAQNNYIIEVKGLVKRYSNANIEALRGIDLQIKAGEFFGLLGPNGSGKTTLISVLCGLFKATQGEAYICGQDIRHHLRRVMHLVGLVPQDIALYPTLTLRQNLKFFANLYGLSGKLLKARVEKYLHITQLTQFADKQIQSFSGGMKRRANLAAGLLHEPNVVFLDEPTVNVDPQSRNLIFESLKELNAKHTTVIYTTHYMEEAQQMCSQIAIIDTGKIITQGTPQKLIDKTPNCCDLGEVFLRLTGKELRD